MKKIFLYLLKKYTKTEKDRLEVYETLYKQMELEYNEQTIYGNFHNATVEYLLNNSRFKYLVNSENSDHSLELVKNNILSGINVVTSLLKLNIKK